MIFIKYFGVIIFFCFFSCADMDTENLFQIEREMLVGTWNVTQDYNYSISDSTVVDFESTLVLKIESNGTVIETNQLTGNEQLFDWFFQYDPKTVILNESQFGVISNTYIYDIVFVNEDEMKWKTDYSVDLNSGETALIKINRRFTR